MARGLYSKYYDPNRIARVRKLQLLARTVVEGYISGLHRSPFKGASAEFAEYREYLPGDDLKRFDWRVFARSDRRFVREYQEETNLTCTLILDASGSMAYHSDGISKYDYACCLCAALAHLMTAQRDQVGLVVAGEKIIERVAPRNTPSHLVHLLGCLEQTSPGAGTGLAKALHEVAEGLKRRGLVILLSDLIADPDEVLNAFRHIRHERHELIVFNVMDPAELEFPFNGLLEFRDLETRETLQVRAEVVRDAYRKAAGEFLTRFQQECARSKIDYQLARTDVPFERMLGAYLQKREKAGK